MGKVYVVTSGEYSDYHIVAVFTNEEQAEKYADSLGLRRGYAEASVEEYDLNPAVPDVRRYHFAQVDHEGEVERTGSFWAVPGSKQTRADVTTRMGEVRREEREEYTLTHRAQIPSVYAVSDRSEGAAVKAARDILAKWKAQREGV